MVLAEIALARKTLRYGSNPSKSRLSPCQSHLARRPKPAQRLAIDLNGDKTDT